MLSILLIGSWKTKRGKANGESMKALEAAWWNGTTCPLAGLRGMPLCADT